MSTTRSAATSGHSHSTSSRYRLPFELEQMICQIAAYNFPECIPNLILIARRFRTWFEPVLYGIMLCGQGKAFPPLYVDHPSIDNSVLDKARIKGFGHHVKQVLLQLRSPREIKEILECCPNVSNLALWLIKGRACAPLIPILEKIPLRKLSIDPSAFFREGYFIPDPDVIPFNQAMFFNLTHLQIINYTSSWSKWQQVALLPKLTHLAVQLVDIDKQFIDSERLLEECQALEVLILFFYDTDFEEVEPASFRTDDRVVLLDAIRDPIGEWLKGAFGKEDFWVKAQIRKEEQIQRKLEGGAVLRAAT